jgi:hypothetical protein
MNGNSFSLRGNPKKQWHGASINRAYDTHKKSIDYDRVSTSGQTFTVHLGQLRGEGLRTCTY